MVEVRLKFDEDADKYRQVEGVVASTHYVPSNVDTVSGNSYFKLVGDETEYAAHSIGPTKGCRVRLHVYVSEPYNVRVWEQFGESGNVEDIRLAPNMQHFFEIID